MEAMSVEQRLERLEKLAGITGPAICSDPTGEGSAWQGSPAPAEPAPGSDAEHPPLGYALVPRDGTQIIASDWIVWEFNRGPWSPISPEAIGWRLNDGFHPHARPIPANEGGSQKAESDRVYVPVPSSKWIPGVPPKPYAVEWFFAKLDEGGIVALKALPDGHSYDFKTADETYFAKERIVGWMQNPDSECIAFGHAVSTTSPESELRATVERLTAENDELRRDNLDLRASRAKAREALG